MKKIVTAVAAATFVAGLNVLACGGMTQVSPPSSSIAHFEGNPAISDGPAVLEDLNDNVMCL